MTIDKRGRGTLPEEIRRDLGLGGADGDIVMFEKTPHGTYEVVPAALIPADQTWFHHPSVQARLTEAEADFRGWTIDTHGNAGGGPSPI
jgi:AbrB family looped-hinge helix DNA binding protein